MYLVTMDGEEDCSYSAICVIGLYDTEELANNVVKEISSRYLFPPSMKITRLNVNETHDVIEEDEDSFYNHFRSNIYLGGYLG